MSQEEPSLGADLGSFNLRKQTSEIVDTEEIDTVGHEDVEDEVESGWDGEVPRIDESDKGQGSFQHTAQLKSAERPQPRIVKDAVKHVASSPGSVAWPELSQGFDASKLVFSRPDPPLKIKSKAVEDHVAKVATKLVHIAILSARQYGTRRTNMRETWLKWITEDREVRKKVDWGFHIVLCKDRFDEGTKILRPEEQQYGDITVHRSRHDASELVVWDQGDRSYEFCGVEADHRLEVFEHVLSLSTGYKFISMIDDDGFLCVPTLLRDLEMLPQKNLVWGKFWCDQDAVRPDSNFFTISTDLMARAGRGMRESGMLPEVAPKRQMFKKAKAWLRSKVDSRAKNDNALGDPVPLGRALFAVISHFVHVLKERVYIFDDDKRIDAQQGWLLTLTQGSRLVPVAYALNHVKKQFDRSLCKRVVWAHRALERNVLEQVYDAAVKGGHLAQLTPQNYSLKMEDTCRWWNEKPDISPPVSSTVKLPVSKSHCKSQLHKLKDTWEWWNVDWMEDLCSHRFVFVRGQHQTGTDLVQKLIVTGTERVLSSFEQQAHTPAVPQYDGQFLQDLWPWDMPAVVRQCFCGCKSVSDWVCLYFCPQRAKKWGLGIRGRKPRARELFYTWRMFWDLKKPVLLEKSQEMGARHVLAMFPGVSVVVFVMRHPLSARKDQNDAACGELQSIGHCIDEWIRMWMLVPQEDVVVVRYESAALEPSIAGPLLQERLVLPSADGGTWPPRLDKEGASSVWQAPVEELRGDKSNPIDVQELAKQCRASPSCEASLQEREAKVARFGYNLMHPERSDITSGNLFVDLKEARKHFGEVKVDSSCNYRLQSEACPKVNQHLTPFQSTCDDAR